MKISTTNIFGRWAHFIGAMMIAALMVPAIGSAQPAPTLVAPADGASTISTTPTVSWNAVAGDSVYHLQISTSSIFASDTVYNDSILTGVSHIIAGLKNSTTYYWHVSVKPSFSSGGGTSPYSTTRNFTTWSSTPKPTPPPLPVALGSTGRFAILTGSGVTNTGTTAVTGDVGTSPIDGSSITGWNTVTVVGTVFVVGPAGPVPSGSFTTNATLLTQAKGDLTTAFNDAAGRTINPIAISGNLGGRTLYAGLYKSGGTLEITAGDLTLDAQGDANAVWIFQIASSFNMTSGRQVFLTGGAKASNVFWQVGTAATFGTTTVMKGTIIAGAQITFATGATLVEGRALAQTEVTMQGNTITRPPIPTVYVNPAIISLGTAANFRILSGTGVTIASGCAVTGDVGAGTTVLNSGTISGTSFNGGATVTTALSDLNTAITNISGRGHNATLGPQLAGTTLGRGIYNSSDGTFDINGTLVLTGSAVDTFIFQMTTTLNTAAGSQIMLIDGALASNVFWQVGSSATLGATSEFKGNILAGTYITQAAGTTLNGKALAYTDYVTVNGTAVLPVELVSFTGSASQKNANLNWSTATEVNNYGFAVERKANDTWNKIGFVEGAGTSSAPKEYSYTDNNLSTGTYSYRLKQIDRGGKFEYSKSVEVTIGQAVKEFALLQNYPNPFNPSTTITYQLPSTGSVTLTVYDVIGKEVATLVNEVKDAGSYDVRFNASSLSSGIYFYTIKSGSFTATKKLTLMK